MGIFNTLKTLALSAKCATGWHGGEFKNEDDKPKCFFSKICPDCNKYIQKIEHKFGDYIITNHRNCEGYKECEYCNLKEYGTYHQYEEIGVNASCQIIKKCRQCGDEQLGATKHSWITIPFTDKEFSVNGKRKCKDCGFIG
ncbi:TPA: hypothetical protein R2A65_000764 [Campylobacter jejuni]|uniref:hypothetical protein n=1 Tax=Campylobacter jejuni TaxID=197 RepID=UPI0008739BF8|nr:hypothetical protein [Campylobacter jejuni]OEX04411.1 hypothetical protein A0M47_03955 [Campylobacter jejuni]HEC1730743.1 hypothetical protein [Campylobacter jejuni]HEC2371235.1 hypothetical protein [Campylobacter jejuni]HEC2398130.1 hypothetical protein [Campylobacter jejuni]